MKGPAKKHQRAAYRVGWPHQIEGVNDEKMNATDSEGTVLKVCRLREEGRMENNSSDTTESAARLGWRCDHRTAMCDALRATSLARRTLS